jgi:hypothetical protein
MALIFVGDDWAEDHHDIHLMDAEGRSASVASATRPDNLLLARHADG